MTEPRTVPADPSDRIDGHRLDGALTTPVPAELAANVPSSFRPWYSITSDLGGNGRFGRSWIGADDTRVLAVTDVGRTVELALADLADFRVDELFGASRLVAVGNGSEHVLATYSRNLVA